MTIRTLLAMYVVLMAGTGLGDESRFRAVQCEGTYRHHFQGICTNEEDAIYWSFTTALVKTDTSGSVVKTIPVANHHGDLCFHDGRIYVAVNLGKFNDPAGNDDSWVYVYDANDLSFVAKHKAQEVFHGAGGIAVRGGHFFVVGGLPETINENYVYEYDGDLKFVKKHVIKSGHTLMGIQTAAFAHGCWWFGCYGNPRVLLKTDESFIRFEPVTIAADGDVFFEEFVMKATREDGSKAEIPATEVLVDEGQKVRKLRIYFDRLAVAAIRARGLVEKWIVKKMERGALRGLG